MLRSACVGHPTLFHVGEIYTIGLMPWEKDAPVYSRFLVTGFESSSRTTSTSAPYLRGVGASSMRTQWAQVHLNIGFTGSARWPQLSQMNHSPPLRVLIGMNCPGSTQYGHRVTVCMCFRCP